VGAQRPYDEVVHSGSRCSEANRSRCARIDPAAKGPEPARAERRSKRFGLPFWRLKKVTRRQGGTLSRRYRSNGYVRKTQRQKESHRLQATSHIDRILSVRTRSTCANQPARDELEVLQIRPGHSHEAKQKPTLTLALSRRERVLTELFGRSAPTCNTESNADSERPTNRLPLPRERAGVRGESTEDLKPCGASNHSTMSVSSRALDLDLASPATSEG